MSLTTIASLALALLKMVNSIMGYINTQKAMDAGRDAEIAKVSASILTKTQTGREILAAAMAMTDDQVDKALKDLEPQ